VDLPTLGRPTTATTGIPLWCPALFTASVVFNARDGCDAMEGFYTHVV
jgi:hypothetical protein